MAWIASQAGEPWVTGAGVVLAAGFFWLLMRGVVRLRRRRDCRWVRAKGRASGSLAGWTCRTCGVLAYSATGRAPADCKRDLRSRPL